MLLVAVGQPLMTDDAWWHIALGRAYAAAGPWLPDDPLLFLAPGPAPPAAWISDLGLHAIERSAGLHGLRAFHVATVAAIVALAWSLLRRASGSPAAASLGTSVFIVLSSYRLFQLRPHLVTILFTLLVYRLLMEDAAPASRWRIAIAAALFALWANLHASFLLGLVLLGTAAAGLVLAGPLRLPEQRPRDRKVATHLAIALGLGVLASLINPNGPAQHLAYFAAGSTTPDLGNIADEWMRLDLFALPPANLPPSALSWGLVWGLFVLMPAAAAIAARGWQRRQDPETPGPGPVQVALAAASLIAILAAVRFLWLGIFPLLLLAACARTARPATRRAATWPGAIAAVLLVPGFVWLGAWPMISNSMPRSLSGYSQPYLAARYNGHAVWLLKDTGLEGNLYNEYYQGGFLGFWLSPGIRTFVNGSLNVPPETLRDHAAVRRHHGIEPGESLVELLDRNGVDIFMGTRLPQVPKPNRPGTSTTAHLENAPGWITVFRNLKSALYLRLNERNRTNLGRVAAYYAGAGVPFDPIRGFEPERVIREAREWAIRHGLAPADLAALERGRAQFDPATQRAALNRLASLYATLGSYERALELDEALLRAHPHARLARRRQVWSLLRLGRTEAALAASNALDRTPPSDRLSHAIAHGARHSATLDDADERARLASRLPVFTRPEARTLMFGLLPPEQRTPGS